MGAGDGRTSAAQLRHWSAHSLRCWQRASSCQPCQQQLHEAAHFSLPPRWFLSQERRGWRHRTPVQICLAPRSTHLVVGVSDLKARAVQVTQQHLAVHGVLRASQAAARWRQAAQSEATGLALLGGARRCRRRCPAARLSRHSRHHGHPQWLGLGIWCRRGGGGAHREAASLAPGAGQRQRRSGGCHAATHC